MMGQTQSTTVKAAAVLLGLDEVELKARLDAPPPGQEPPTERLLQPTEAARLLGICRKSLDRLEKLGKIKKIKIFGGHQDNRGRSIGGRVGFRLSDVQKLIRKGAVA